ncbi:hypothetical protein HYPSUDRAFT_189259 [Hypholoma sublateritium FD-334 SS-4]|uniref:NAD-dependent epimerase/dehydratase domain-containing protein n=1 Tax=Hypholoma sublateritium (strain FD-334 SS-4) TaxID=945553 RepID=A0A0D2KZZ7_HYPSF|nr:hypothetical protein HYPSUDRAFT_189259 [Hypholoma sublateritium FD-334 SS-4]
MSKLIFVTGASGFLASHVIYQLLQDGYRVRATARGKKVAALKELYSAHPALEIVEVPDIAHSQFAEALADVDAVIHTATPLPARVDPETMLHTAIEGSLNVLRQAEKAGVRKFVVTSSTAAINGDPTVVGVSFRTHHWNPAKKEEINADTDPVEAYSAAKALSERAVWDWAAAHPHVDVTTINPTYIYGPAAPLTLRLAPGDFVGLSTNLFIYNLITPPGQHLPGAGSIDVRDAARAHIGALGNDATAAPGARKRAILASPHGLVERYLFELYRKERPAVAGRMIAGEGVVPVFDRYDLDFAEIESFTGMKKSDYHTMEQTFLDALDSLLVIEKDWKEQGFVVKDVPLMQA